MRDLRPTFWILVWGLALVACAGESTLAPGEVSLSQQVQPIFSDRCAFSGCHGAMSPAAGQSLAEGRAYVSLVKVASQELPTMHRVEPGDPDLSYLVHKIQGTHVDVGGNGLRMPRGQEPLSDDQINLIRSWIRQGARNN